MLVHGLYLVVVSTVCLYLALACLLWQRRKEESFAEALKSQTGEAWNKARKECQTAARNDLECDRERLMKLIEKFRQIVPLMSYTGNGPTYSVQVDLRREMIFAMAQGNQDEWRYFSRFLAESICRDLATLNIERFRRSDVEQRERQAIKMRHMGYGRIVEGDPEIGQSRP